MPDVRVLFRYRDLVAPTLARHRSLISSAGHCWWGWWKRPSEDARLDVWNALVARLKANKKETIGLFHSGNGEVHLAEITAVIPPADEAASRPPVLTSAQRKNVPEYYRESVFSRAWLKMTNIAAKPLKATEFYGVYAYDAPPPLPRILPGDLDRLRNKKIVDDHELRAMDATIWLVKKADAHSGDSHFLAPSPRVVQPISREPISVKGTKILHLSDIHYDERAGNASQHAWSRSGRKPIHDMIANAIGDIVPDVGLLLVSGDITFWGSEAEYNLAHASIYALTGVLGLGPEHVVMCPGNHDIVWTRRKRDTYDPRREFVPSEAPEKAKKNYAAFYQKLLLHAPNQDLSMGRRYVMPHGLVFEICALNSTSLAAGRKYLAGMGRVGPAAFEAVRVGMGWRDRSAAMALRALLIHHHLVQTEDVEAAEEYYSGFGLAIDAQKTLREGARAGISLAIHGHRHRPFYWRSSVYELPEHAHDTWECGDVAIIGGGSAGSTEVDDANFFNVIDIQAGYVRSVMYRSKDGAPFKPIRAWRANVLLGPQGLALAPWTVDAAAT
jgi:hypothetical protein